MEEEVPTVIRASNIGANPVFVKDIFMKKTPAELEALWAEKLDSSVNFSVRDSLLEAMRRKSVRPETWLTERNISSGIYPDIEDPDFASRLFRKTEFASLASVMSEDTCAASRDYFETTPVQRLVARFLHPSTPYRGLLLNHGVGVGKTCSAITVAETFLEIMPHHTVFILAPQAVADSFKRTIFDSAKLTPTTKAEFTLTGDRWKSNQCTGMSYLRLTGTANAESREEIEKEVEKQIRRRYTIVGYLAFANWVERKLKTIPAMITGQARRDKENALLLSLFSDHLIIIDEAHNLRDSDGVVGTDKDEPAADEADPTVLDEAANGKKLTPLLKRILSVAEGLRIMLMTATPMYNTAPEILFLLNLLTLNDTKDESALLREREIFKSDGSFVEGGSEKLTKIVKRYVSYMRGENPNTFPLRLTPPESAGRAFLESYPTVSISRRENVVTLSPMDKNIMAALPFIVSHVDPSSRVGTVLTNALMQHARSPEERAAEPTEMSSFILDQTMQIGNITYPSGAFGTRGWEAYMKSSPATIKGTTISQFTWTPVDPGNGSELPTLESVFAGDGLASHAPKLARIVKSISNAKGISFVYSRYVKAGALPMAIALELAGWCRVLADGTPAPLLKPRSGVAVGQKPTNYYILLTSDEGLTPNFKGLLEYATTLKDEADARGRKVKAIIGSQVASEGLDLKCIRELHIVDGWYHLNRIEQITGRGVRFCSHVALPMAERNCLVYLHAVHVPKYETADLYAYRLAVRKAQPMGRVSRLMKIHAWDCMLNIDAILLKDISRRVIVDGQGREIKNYDVRDKPYTSFCDFSTTCEYICGSKPISPTNIGKNTSTYEEFDYRRMFVEKQKLLAGIFEDEVAEPLDTIKNIVYEDIPWAIGAIGLREVLGKMKIKRKDGIYGTLILQNGYVVFQPEHVTDRWIPLALRYGRAYGRLPRTILPERGSIFESSVSPAQAAQAAQAAAQAAQAAQTGVQAAQAAQAEEAKPVAANAAAVSSAVVPVAHISSGTDAALRERAMQSVQKWRILLARILSEPEGVIPEPEGYNTEAFLGWRWLFYHFRALPETVPLAIRWWIENEWTSEERRAVFLDWTTRGIDSLTGDDAMYARLFRPVELFASDEMNGCIIYDTPSSSLQTYCHIEGSPPSLCTTILEPTVRAILGDPVHRVNDTGPIFGMLVHKAGTIVFKSVDKVSGKPDGAECANSSNLDTHEARIRNIQMSIRSASSSDGDAGIVTLLLEDDPEKRVDKAHRQLIQESLKKRYMPKSKARDASLTVTHISHMSLKQSCPYMEFLLRWMDMNRVGGKRWFLSVVDTERARLAEEVLKKGKR